MNKFTIEDLRDIAYRGSYDDLERELALQLLASMEQEPVACIDRANLDYLESGADADVWPASGAGSDDVLLYAAPQLPQPSIAPDGLRLALSNAGIAAPESDEMLFATHEKYIQLLVSWVKDRRPFKPAAVPDAVEPTLEAIKAILPTSNPDHYACCVGADMWNACRAAMLHAGNHTEQHLDMVVHSGDTNEKGKDGTLINEGTMPVTQIKPVADLYGITSPTGSETIFTFDAGEASSFAKGGWTVQEYVKLERYQEAMLQGTELDFREISNSSTKHFRETAETSTKCWCHTCRPVTMSDMRFVVCPECGNKRCPHANDHRNACTGSNEPGQEGSAYPAAPQQEVKP